MSALTSSTALWYVSRATGVVALVLLTVVMLLGLLVTRQGRLPGLPRFAVGGLHRNLSLLATVFLAVHVLSAVADGFVDVPLASALVPFASPYERFWLGVGAVSSDLILAALVTSLVRNRLSRRAWLAVHLTTYVSWPIAWFHSLFSSNDLQGGLLLALTIACAVVVLAAAVWRLAAASRDVPRAERAGLLLTALHNRGSGHWPGGDAPGRERTLSR